MDYKFNMQERLGSGQYFIPERARKLASQASEIAASQGIRSHQMFGNNFILLFTGIKRAMQVETGEISPEEQEAHFFSYARFKKLQSYGSPSTRFMEQNSQLLAEINTALDDEFVFQGLFDHLRDLLREKKYDESEEFERSVHPELGIEAVGIVVWNRLNPLFEKAAQALQEVGIPPEEFYS